MRNTVIVILFIIGLSAKSQTLSGIHIENKDTNRVEIEKAINYLNAQIVGTRYCILKYTSQSYTAYAICGVGGALLAMNSLKDLTVDDRKYITYGGSLLMLVGVICKIDAYKWLNRINLAPAEYGIGVKAIF